MVYMWCKCEQNRTKAIEVIEQNPYLLTESQNDGIIDMLKTVYPPKTPFCRGGGGNYNYDLLLDIGPMQSYQTFLRLGQPSSLKIKQKNLKTKVTMVKVFT